MTQRLQLVVWLATAMGLVVCGPCPADERIRERARQAVSRSDVQSTLEFGNLREEFEPRASTRGPAIVPVSAEGIGKPVLWFGLLVVGGLILLTAWRLIADRRLAPSAKPQPAISGAAGSPEAAIAHWLEDADQLAAESRWTEAVHALLLAAIARLSSELGRPRPSRTSRELLRQFPLSGSRQSAFQHLVTTVEAAVFGERCPGPLGYDECRESAAIVLGEGA